MIKTNCSTCCFCDKETKSFVCLAGQFCVNNEHTPGTCRLHRPYSWLNKHGTNIPMPELMTLAKKDAMLDDSILLVVFDESTTSIEALDKTICHLWDTSYFNQVVIADLTKNENRTNILIDYIKSSKININQMKVDYTVDETRESTTLVIRRIARKFNSKYFMVISAGSTILNPRWALDQLNGHLLSCQSRCVYWYFPKLCGHTILIEKNPIDGLYLTSPYKFLVNKSADPFIKQLEEFENSVGMSFSYLFDECIVVHSEGNNNGS